MFQRMPKGGILYIIEYPEYQVYPMFYRSPLIDFYVSFKTTKDSMRILCSLEVFKDNAMTPRRLRGGSMFHRSLLSHSMFHRKPLRGFYVS